MLFDIHEISLFGELKMARFDDHQSLVDGSMRKIVAILQFAGNDSDFCGLLLENPLRALSDRGIDLTFEEQRLLVYVLEGGGDSEIADASRSIDPSWLERLLAYKKDTIGV